MIMIMIIVENYKINEINHKYVPKCNIILFYLTYWFCTFFSYSYFLVWLINYAWLMSDKFIVVDGGQPSP